jgi:hypothetical protein
MKTVVLDTLRDRVAAYGQMTYEPLTVRLWLASARAGYDSLNLDGLLAWCVLSSQMAVPAMLNDAYYFIPLPCRMLWQSPEGYPLWATTAFLGQGWQTVDTEYTNRQFDPELFTRRGRTLVQPGAGEWRPRRSVVPLENAAWYEAQCLGNGEEIERLLQQVIGVGKRRGAGYGAIDRYRVVPAETYSYTTMGALARPIPAAARGAVGRLPAIEPEMIGWTTPYWHPGLWALGWRTGTPVEIDWYGEALA